MPKEAKKVAPDELAELIANASALELSETAKILEEKYGISVQAPAAPTPAAAGAGGDASAGEAAEGQEEKTTFTVELKSPGDKKIDVIKAVRDITGKGLKDAKDFVEAAASAPQIVKDNVKKEEAEEIKKKLEAAGAKVELK